jgi:hypothetical protein
MINRNITFIILVFILTTSCTKLYTDEGIPSFVHIDKIDFSAGIGQGTDSAHIADAWVYIGNDLIGTYELPVTFPVLKTGNQTITIRPGVILNGVSATRSINPFMESDDIKVNLIADSIIAIKPKSSYVSNAKFPWNSVGQEDFEQSGISIDSITGSSTNIFKSKVDVYEGDYSGQIHLDIAHKFFQGASVTDFAMPSDKNGMVMEINCKNPDAILTIGIFFSLTGGTVSKEEYLFINPGDKWKKLYVNFTQLVNKYTDAKNFKVFFKATLPSGKNSTDIFLDNIKLIHF